MSIKLVHLKNWGLSWQEQWRAIPWWGQCLALWLVAWVVLTGVGMTAVRLFDLREGYPPDLGLPAGSLPGLWARWDSGQYLELAYQGYAAVPESAGYLPLYPVLMVGLSRLTGLSLEMAGMLIAQLSYLVALLLFYKLARLIRDEHAYAMGCVLALLLFPSSFFFFALYAESVALALSILAVYLILRPQPRYVLAGLALGIASAARPTGWLLDVVLLVEFIRRRQFNWRTVVSVGVGLSLSVLGVILFVLYLYSITGSFLAIPHAQAVWERHWQYPWLTFWNSLRVAVTGQGLENDWFLYAINWSDLLFTSLVLAATAYAAWQSLRRQMSWSFTFYLFATLLFLLSSEGSAADPLWGMTRWVAMLFPIYLLAGEIIQRIPRVWRWATALASTGLLIFFTAWWISGRWVG